MAEADIRVDLYNPGQVFACLGFLEAAEILLGDAEGGFDWSDKGNIRFRLRADGDRDPIGEVFQFLVRAEIERFGPTGYRDPPPKKRKEDADEEDPSDEEDSDVQGEGLPAVKTTEAFPAREGDKMTLPIRLRAGRRLLELGHWGDGSGRDTFKLYSGNRSAYQIARAMLKGVREKPAKDQKARGEVGNVKYKGISSLWEDREPDLVKEPFNVVTAMGGSFNFDPRGAWTAIDAGYSPNDQNPKHSVVASPVVELLAAVGLEHARPVLLDGRGVRYAAWGVPLAPMMARAALAGVIAYLPQKQFSFKLNLSGKNKIVTFAEEEMSS